MATAIALTGSQKRVWHLLGILFAALLATATGQAREKNGFDLDNALVPVDEIHRGGPPRDGIPAILEPRFVAPDAAELPWREGDLMLTFDAAEQSWAFPIGILNWHEIVNHRIDGQPYVITLCPLCGTGVAFDPVVDGRELTFGVSGLLYNSDLLMYDHQTESLWSQIEGRAISGPLVATELEPVAIRHELWQNWRERAGSKGRVLSTDTGHSREYRRSPYGDYDHSEGLYFPVSRTSRLYHPKTWVLGYEQDGQAMAWPFPELEAAGDGPVTSRVGGKTLTVHYDGSVPTAELRDESGRLLPAMRAFWFAWYTFHPETEVFQAD